MSRKIYQITIFITLILFIKLQLSYSAVGSCHPSCGSQDETGCTDYAEEFSYPTNCKICSFGYVGGGGDGISGDLCIAGKCNKACVSCKDQTTLHCYICASGYYDTGCNPLVGTECKACHPSCLSCVASKNACTPQAVTDENSCLICAPGYFDPDENVYFASACTKCSDKCVACRKQADKCISCAPGFFSSNEVLGGTCIKMFTLENTGIDKLKISIIIFILLIVTLF